MMRGAVGCAILMQRDATPVFVRKRGQLHPAGKPAGNLVKKERRATARLSFSASCAGGRTSAAPDHLVVQHAVLDLATLEGLEQAVIDRVQLR